MKLRGVEKARKAVTTVVVVALVFALAYGISGLVSKKRPSFALAANKGFAITSQVYASTCTKTAGAKLAPGVTRCLAVTVHNPLSVAIEVTALSMKVSFTPPKVPDCSPTTLSYPTPLFSGSLAVGAGKTATIDKSIQFKTTDKTQDSCEGGTFDFTFSGTARYTDTTTTTLTATLTGMTTATLKATVTPANPTAIPYGPASTTAPVHHVTFYSCGTATCTSKTPLKTGTVRLTQTTPTTKVATATYEVTGLSAGTHYYEAAYPAKGTHPGTFTGSTSAIESVRVVTKLPAVCKGKKFQHYIIYPFFPVVYGTNQSDLIVVGDFNFIVYGFQGTDCIVAGNGNNLLFDGTGDDGVQAGNGQNQVFLGNGNDKVSLGSGTDSVLAGNGADTVTVGNGWGDQVLVGNGTDSVTAGNGNSDTVKVGNGNDTVALGTGSYDTVVLGNGTDKVTIQSPGSHDTIHAGEGTETISLGDGNYNTFLGYSKSKDTCSVPKPPSSYKGSTPAGYYHDTVTKCTVVVT